MRKTSNMFVLSMAILFILAACGSVKTISDQIDNISSIATYEPEQIVTIDYPVEERVVIEETIAADKEINVTTKEIELIALVTMGEAEGECEEGKRLVIDTILNRVDSKRFPNTIHEVIYQPAQFSPMWDGRIDRCEVREDICKLVREELESRVNYEIVFFHSGRYSKYGVPLFNVGNHYFSKHD